MDQRFRRALAVVLVAVLVVGAGPALAAVANYASQIQGGSEVPVSTDQTPTIVLSTSNAEEVNLRDYAQGSELVLNTTQGNITVSGDDGASAVLALTDITGTSTQVTSISAGSNWLELDPEDKQRVDIRGDAEALSFKSIAADDGTTDLQITGPTSGTAEVRLYDLSANTRYGLYDPSRDEFLGTFATDGSGVGQTNVDLPDGSQSLEVRTAGDVAAPTLSNPSPTGRVTESPDTLSVDVEGQGYPINVSFYLEGEFVGSENVTSNGTASTSVNVGELGTFEWSAVATDGVTQQDTINASFETPQNITIREEHAPQQVVNNTTVTLRFFTADGEIAIEKQTDDGTVNMTGLPDSEFIAFAESPEHYDRRIYVSSIFNQSNMYLLNETVFPRSNNSAIRSRFIYEDLTGNFPQEDTTIQIQRAIDLNGDNRSEFRTVSGDFWGATAEFADTLEFGERYRILLVNRETGERTVQGSHVPTEDLTQTIRVSGLTQEAQNRTGAVGLAEYNESSGQIDIAYTDSAAKTDTLQVVVESRDGNQTLLNETVDGPFGTYSKAVALNDSQQDKDWLVRFEANGGDRHRSVIPVGAGTVGLPVAVPSWLLTLLMTMSMTFVGALYGPRTALLGAWAMVIVAGGVWMFGWAFSGASVVVAALVASGVTFVERVRPA